MKITYTRIAKRYRIYTCYNTILCKTRYEIRERHWLLRWKWVNRSSNCEFFHSHDWIFNNFDDVKIARAKLIIADADREGWTSEDYK